MIVQYNSITYYSPKNVLKNDQKLKIASAYGLT